MKTHLRLVATLTFFMLLTACQLLDNIGIGSSSSVPAFATATETSEQALQKASLASNAQVANQYRLIAANKFLQQNKDTQVKSTLSQLTAIDLSNSQKIIADMLNAELSYKINEIAKTLTLLSTSTFDSLDDEDPYLQVRVRTLKANAYTQEGKYLQALRERSYVSSFLSGQASIDNQNTIWRLAMSMPLDVLQNSKDGGETGGWLELASIVKGSSTLQEQQANVEQWLKNNPTHSAAINPPEEILKAQELTTDKLQKIAILLPQKEKYAQAIYNGFLAAYYQSSDKDKPTIKLYESTDYTSIDAFYEQALKDGVQLVIGPIDKKTVNELSRKATLPITTLALNYSDTNAHPPQLFQFGLLPEDEAREVANRAWNDGRRNAIAIIPRSEWGKKVFAAFRQTWEQQGGVLEGIQYIDRPVDLDRQLVELTRKLPANGASSTWEDENMLFMLADPRMARQIRALLIYHNANKLPVYATSHIYTGMPDAAQDNDLNGILFCETPWLVYGDNPIQQQIEAQWPQAKTNLARLYAMGVDTWQLTPRLNELKTLSSSRINGLSGQLTINSLQRVERILPWVTFEKGLIKPAAQQFE